MSDSCSKVIFQLVDECDTVYRKGGGPDKPINPEASLPGLSPLYQQLKSNIQSDKQVLLLWLFYCF